MTYEKLVCPSCKCPLTASPSQTQVACPRCFTWLELESNCSGVCISCHAAKKTVGTGSCADLGSEVPVTIERSSAKGDSSSDDVKNKSDKEGIKALFKRVFHV